MAFVFSVCLSCTVHLYAFLLRKHEAQTVLYEVSVPPLASCRLEFFKYLYRDISYILVECIKVKFLNPVIYNIGSSMSAFT